MDRAVDWDSGAIVAVDQTVLPAEVRHLRLTTVDEVVDAIRRLVVRGAPVIGVTGRSASRSPPGRTSGRRPARQAAVRRDAQRIADGRPTAVNLRWAVERVLTRLPDGADAVLAEAHAVRAEDERANATAARRAADVLRERVPGPAVAGAHPLQHRRPRHHRRRHRLRRDPRAARRTAGSRR